MLRPVFPNLLHWMREDLRSDKELRSISSGSGVSHGKKHRFIVFQFKVFILKLFSPKVSQHKTKQKHEASLYKSL